MKILPWVSMVGALTFECMSAFAFNTDQHHAVTGQAVDGVINLSSSINQLGSSYPDVQKFRSKIVSWTGGVGWDLSAFGYPDNELPAESLAHTLNQTIGICSIPNNGGDFTALRDGVFLQYGSGKFAGTDVSDEGAYVLIGSMLHLIEDQASMPHGANVHHGQCSTTVAALIVPDLFSSDKFENPGHKTGGFSREGSWECRTEVCLRSELGNYPRIAACIHLGVEWGRTTLADE